ncbi:hypothetical protein B5F08_04985 [Anaeromassilibacillus sp. An172]|uniref:hypothetical protein n=1 Tax=Anaeromassilibacillus sp. An172 TaxID=1965570 RepID=UPI000B38A9C2|nr:hypothetical protein [Anaeromassilibacillus sp. An172]OUP79343.1 hypothetical protein B5F08_04985 [Anaeromassilibacillus sp. An172]
MIKFLTDKITDLVNGFVSEQEGKIKGVINKKTEEKSLEKRFEESSKRFFDEKIENSLSIEEIDFPALNEYVKKNLLTQVRDSLLFKDKWGSLSDSCFINSCINVAKADTPEKERIVCAYVRTAREIVKSFYMDKNSIEQQILLGEHFSNLFEYAEARHMELMTGFDKMYKDIAYINSFASVIDRISPKTLNLSPFHYRNDIITFRGREEEQKEIYSFLDDERKLLWMSISGDGGSGKSKLMYHMTQKLESNDCWKVIWLGEQSLQSIMSKDKFEYPINLLFVCDYGGQFSEKLGDFIERLCTFDNTYSEKIRLIILEREGFTQVCDRLLEPMWYRSFRGNISRNHCIDSTAFDKNKSLNLKPLNDDDFKGIVKDYLAEKKKSLSDEKINTVIKKTHEIDDRKTGARPLILLFVADAVADGNEAENWDLNNLVEHVIKRYEDHWKNVICKGDEELFKAVKEIIAYATAVGGWNLKNKKIVEPIKNAIDVFLKKVEDKNMFLCSICEKTETDGIWTTFEPDLLGEFFVLEFLREKIQNYDDEYVSNFSDICWENSSVLFAWFLSRCVQNYCMQERFNTIFADDMEMFEPNDEENAVWYSYILVNMTFYQTVEKAGETVKKLEMMSQKYITNQKFQASYANGLVNLSRVQELREREKTIEELKNLSESSPENQEIQTIYAKGLVNLSNKQELKESEKTIEELKNLSESSPENQEVRTVYANGLVNLSSVQELQEREKTIEELKRLSESVPENQEVRTEYAKGLVNLSSVQELQEREKTIEELKNLSESSPENQEVRTEYAKGLFNLSNVQELREREKTVEKLKKLWRSASENQEIQTAYARGLLNLSNVQELKEGENTVEKLKELWELSPENQEVRTEYAKGLFNLSNVQELQEREKIIEELKNLSESSPENQEVRTVYANGLANFSAAQKLSEIGDTIDKLKNLESIDPQNLIMQTAYMIGIMNMTLKKAEHYKTKDSIESDIAEIKKYAEEHKGNEELQKFYNQFLDDLNEIFP